MNQRALSPRQVEAIFALPGPQRFEHTVKQVADWQLVWALRDQQGWLSAADELGRPGFAIWPQREYAQACIAGAWSGGRPEALEVHEFLERVLPGLVEQQSRVAVLPTPSGSVVFVSAEEFAQALRYELSRVE